MFCVRQGVEPVKYSYSQRMPLPDIGGDWCATEYSPPFLTVQAEDYDTRIAGPRREERLRRMEEQMKSIRGFRGEGQTLRGEEPVSSSLGQRELHDVTADSQRQLDNRHHVKSHHYHHQSHDTYCLIISENQLKDHVALFAPDC